jgi:hypothetical protein
VVLDANVFISAALGVIRGDTVDSSPSVRIFYAMRDELIVNLVTTASVYEIAEKLQPSVNYDVTKPGLNPVSRDNGCVVRRF